MMERAVKLNVRRWWLNVNRLPDAPHTDWRPFFLYFPKVVEGRLGWWEWAEISYFFAVDLVWCHRYRWPR